MHLLYSDSRSSDMKIHPNSPHLSIKRLRQLAEDYCRSKGETVISKTLANILPFISFVEQSRSSLGGRPKNPPLSAHKKS